jgi:hypothetical protein
MIKKIAFVATLALVSSTAMAAEPTWYVGGDVSTTKGDGDSHQETGYGAFGGYQFNPSIALEAGVRRLVSEGDFHVNQVAFSAVGTLPVGNNFSVFGRLGVNRLTLNGGGASDSATRGLYGIGVAYNFSSAISARMEVTKPMSDLTNLSIGVSYKF